MSRALWEISAELSLVEKALTETDGADLSPLTDYLEHLVDEREAKVDAYLRLIRELESRSEARAAEADRLMNLARTDRNAVDHLKRRLLEIMAYHAWDRIETEHFRLARVKTGGKPALELDDVPADVLPAMYTTIITAPDKEAIRAALERGEQLTFARLKERGEHLRIR